MMDNQHLLIIDQDPERAEQINSLLRNSGINIHINCADTLADTERAITKAATKLVICCPGAFQAVPAERIFELARQHALPVALYLLPDDSNDLGEALEHGSCMVIHAAHQKQLIDTVQRVLRQDRLRFEQRSSQSRLDELEERYRLLLDSSKEPTAYLHEGLHVYANPAYLEMLQIPDFSSVEALSLMELATSNSQDLKTLLRDMSLGTFPDGAVEVQMHSPGGGSFEAQLHFSAARFDGEDCIQLKVRQKDAQARLKDELDRLRRTDQLTRLSNRSHFLAQLEQFLDGLGELEGVSAVLYLEPDNAAEIQARSGISAFDQVVATLAEAVRSSIDQDDAAARLSDHGISVLATRASRQDLLGLSERVMTRFSENQQHAGLHSGEPMTCSIGLVMLGEHTASAEEALSQARTAFGEAAGEGGSLRQWNPPAIEPSEEPGDQQWAERIRFAMNSRQLYSVQQSIVNLEGESEGLFENRTFMRDGSRDLPAEIFLPHAERTDLGTAVDRHVIPGLLRSIAGSGDRHIINLSANSILDFSFASWFLHQMEELGVEGSQLILQMPTPAAVSNLKPCLRLSEEIRAHGCGFSLSAFDDQRRHGELLEELGAGWVKLRPGLAPGIAQNSANQDIVRNVFATAERVNAQVIADEVQDAADLAVLWQCGVKLVSGEFLKEPPQVVGQ